MKQSVFNINIYRPESKKKKRGRSPYEPNRMGIILLVSFLILFGVTLYIAFGLYVPQKRLFEEKSSEAERIEKRLEGLKSIARDLTSKKELYIKIRGEGVTWPEKLLAVSQAVPENIWFSKLEFAGRSGDSKGGQNVVFMGATFSGWMEENLDQIGDLISQLNRSDEFKEGFGPIRLDYTKKYDKSWGMTQFQYICQTTDLSN